MLTDLANGALGDLESLEAETIDAVVQLCLQGRAAVDEAVQGFVGEIETLINGALNDLDTRLRGCLDQFVNMQGEHQQTVQAVLAAFQGDFQTTADNLAEQAMDMITGEITQAIDGQITEFLSADCILNGAAGWSENLTVKCVAWAGEAALA
jgi:uncharacterized membrane-anchored protein YjiN (DUF445 family)